MKYATTGHTTGHMTGHTTGHMTGHGTTKCGVGSSDFGSDTHAAVGMASVHRSIFKGLNGIKLTYVCVHYACRFTWYVYTGFCLPVLSVGSYARYTCMRNGHDDGMTYTLHSPESGACGGSSGCRFIPYARYVPVCRNQRRNHLC